MINKYYFIVLVEVARGQPKVTFSLLGIILLQSKIYYYMIVSSYA